MRGPFEDRRDDATLVAAVAGGDREALALLYGRHAPWLLARLSYRCADGELVDEVVQDTFVSVWRHAAGFRGQGEVAAWIWGIGIRRLVDGMRRARRRARRAAAAPPAEPASPSAEDLVLVGIEHGDLAGALGRLSPELRAALQATVLDGLTTREAAELLGIPIGTVKTRAMRARNQLRRELA